MALLTTIVESVNAEGFINALSATVCVKPQKGNSMNSGIRQFFFSMGSIVFKPTIFLIKRTTLSTAVV
jgi:hypothetical protein